MRNVMRMLPESEARIAAQLLRRSSNEHHAETKTASLVRATICRASLIARNYMVGKPAARDMGARHSNNEVSNDEVSSENEPSAQRPQANRQSSAGQSSARQIAARTNFRRTTTEQLLARYRLRRSRPVLDEVVERHRATVETMAYGLVARLPRSVDVQDLVHAGMWGLMQSISTFEPERCDSFDSFMRIRVRGAMLDELRHMDFLPRLFRRRVRERDAARAELRMELEREPTNSELADALGITEDALLRCPDSHVLRSVHGRESGDGDDHYEQLADDAIESPIEVITRQELLDIVRKHLEPIEWKVLKLHYLDGLTGRQVAQRLRLSASRICQIHVAVLDRLKQELTAAAV